MGRKENSGEYKNLISRQRSWIPRKVKKEWISRKTGGSEEYRTIEGRVTIWEETSNQECPIMAQKGKAESAWKVSVGPGKAISVEGRSLRSRFSWGVSGSRYLKSKLFLWHLLFWECKEKDRTGWVSQGKGKKSSFKDRTDVNRDWKEGARSRGTDRPGSPDTEVGFVMWDFQCGNRDSLRQTGTAGHHSGEDSVKGLSQQKVEIIVGARPVKSGNGS